MSLSFFARFNEILNILLEKRKSESGSSLEFSELAFSYRGDGHEAIAGLSPSLKKVRELAKLMGGMRERGAASEACFQELAGKPGFARTAVMRRPAKACLKPIYELVAAWK